MKTLKMFTLLCGLLCILTALPRAQADRVIYVPHYTDSLLKAMDERSDKLQAERDSVTGDILDRIEKEADAEKKDKRTLRFDLSKVTKPTSPDVFQSAFHFPPVPQYRTGTCWAFAGTSLVESEITRLNGREIKLSEMFTVYCEYLEKCRNFIRRRGEFYVSQGSEANAVLRMIKKYGAVPRDIYPGHTGDEIYDHEQMSGEIRNFLKNIEAHDYWDEEHVLNIIRVILDRYMGPPPRSFEFEGRSYTPLEFSKQVLRFDPDNYAGVISTLSLPFYSQGKLDVRDNWWHDSTYYTLPLDEWYRLLEKDLGEGFTVSLGGDVSEPG